MTSTHKTYAREFKLEVVAIVVGQGLSIKELIKTTKVGRAAINRWVK